RDGFLRRVVWQVTTLPADAQVHICCSSAIWSELGQQRRFRNVGDESAYPPIAALERTCPRVAFVPKAAVSNRSKEQATRSPRRRGRAASMAHRGRAPWQSSS